MSNCNAGSNDCNFQCPHGGSWFVCESAPYFVGCCSSDPCKNTDSASPCPDVYPASFNESIYDSIRPNNCIDAPSKNWFTCAETNPPFIGCCKSNPCGQTTGCPTDDLIPAAWSQSSLDQLVLFLDGAPSRTGVPQPTSTAQPNSGLSNGAIAGIAIGAAVAVIIILASAFFLIRRRRRRSREGGVIGEPTIHVDGPGPFYQAVPQQADSRLSASPGYLTSKHRASSSIGTSYGSPTLVSDSRPLSEAYSPTLSEDPRRWNQGLQIDGIPTSPAQAKFVPELDSTPNEVHELEGR